MILELIMAGSIAPAIITTEYCTDKKEAAQFMVETSYFVTERDMKRLFPRHSHIIYEIYNSESNPKHIPQLIYAECMKDAAV